MLQNILNLDGIEVLNKHSQKSIKGGSYDCYCNGHPTGTASSPAGCAAKCDSCVNNGGCKPNT